ncbi:MAG: hypothetical protein JNK67_15750 [Alphaproteobacteria bacterium]|nr:hypothetical protein [Alphaproteobacteria bacterium]
MTPGQRPDEVGALIGEDPRFQARMWRIERVAWVAMVLVIASGLAGAFGNGWLATQTAASHSGETLVAYDSLMRWSVEYELHAKARGDLPHQAVELDAGLLEGLRIVDTQRLRANELVIRVTPRRRFDRIRGAIRLGGDERVPIDVVVLP